MPNRKRLIWLIAIGLCVLLALFFFSLTGYNFSGFICLGCALVLTAYFIFRNFPCAITRWMQRVLTILLIIGGILASITGFFIGSAAAGTDNEDCEYIIVLGAAVHGTVPSLSLRERLDAAYDYLTANPGTICIVSGGQGSGEDITEAACMYAYLTEKGIDAARIWQESKATSTKENIAYSLDLIEEATGTRPSFAGIVSSEYHLFRAGLIARSQNLETTGIPATTTWLSLRINYFLREIAAIWYYMLLGG